MNIFQSHYFDMNRDHLDGKLLPMKLGKDLEKVDTSTLVINVL